MHNRVAVILRHAGPDPGQSTLSGVARAVKVKLQPSRSASVRYPVAVTNALNCPTVTSVASSAYACVNVT